MNRNNKLKTPKLGELVNKAIPDTIKGPKKTEDLPIKL